MTIEEEEEAYSQGHQAYHDGHTLKDNPFKRFTEQWDEWKSGWNDEKSDDPYWEKIRRIQRKAWNKLIK
jgi:ribosome modulation factor